jgi:ribosomal protein S2
LKINLHLAHVSKNRNLYINRYLLGKRVARDVFNLNSIFYSFYLIIPFIQALIRKKKKMLFFSLEPKIAFFFKHLINKILQYYIEIP